MSIPDRLSDRIAALGPLSPTLARAVAYFDLNRVAVISASAIDLANAIGTSDATVIRAARVLGYGGLSALKRALAAEMAARSPAQDLQTTLDTPRDSLSCAMRDGILAGLGYIERLAAPQAAAAMTAIASQLHHANRIALFGMGPTAALVDYAAQRLTRGGRRVITLTASGAGLADQLLAMRAGDGVLAFSHGAPYREVDVALSEAARLGCPTFLATDNAQSQLIPRVQGHIVIARRGSHRVALNTAILAFIEALDIGLATLGQQASIAQLQRLEGLRHALARADGLPPSRKDKP
ncbi:MurR/RpiR family transcriptional regulator [Ketogulonicigenium robustum]|nr:MurR/RpiR family transcriptional regulator [Ketogulonicigenium robustum]